MQYICSIVFQLFVLSFLFSSSLFAQNDAEFYSNKARNARLADKPDEAIKYATRAESIGRSSNNLDFRLRHDIYRHYMFSFRNLGLPGMMEFYERKILLNLESELAQQSGKSLKRLQHAYYMELGRMAGIFNSQQQFDSAYVYYLKAKSVAAQQGEYGIIAASYNNLGLFHYRQKESELALRYYRKALATQQLQNKGDSLAQLSIKDNLATYYIDKGNLDSARLLLEYNFKVIRSSNRKKQTHLRRGIHLLELYVLQEDLAAAQPLLTFLKSLLPEVNKKKRYENKLQLLALEREIARINGDRALDYALVQEHDSIQAEYIEFTTQNNKKRGTLTSNHIQDVLEMSNRQLEKQAKLEKQELRKNYIFLIVMILAALLIATLFVINYRRKNKIVQTEKVMARQMLEISELQNEQLNSELSHKNQDFSQLIMQLSVEEGWNQEVIQQLEGIKSSGDYEEGLRNLILQLKLNASTYEQIKRDQKGAVDANAAFYEKLKSAYPDLTKSEVETCGLIRMNIQTKEIAVIRKIAPSSVRKLRQRIKRKLDLSVEEDLYEFIQKL